MKKIILTLLTGTLALICNAQYIRPKAPDNALLVINYSGSTLTKNVPLSKVNSYEFVKNKIFNELGFDSVSSIEQTGIDFEKDILQYAVMEDSANSFVTILPLQNQANFLKLIQKEKESVIENSGAYKTMALADNKYLGWTSNTAVFVYTTHKKPAYNYRSDIGIEETEAATNPGIDDTMYLDDVTAKVDSMLAAADSAALMDEEMDEELEAYLDSTKTTIDAAAEAARKRADTTKPTESDRYESKRDNWFTLREKYVTQKQKHTADSIIKLTFSRKQLSSIEDNSDYQKTIDATAPVSLWFNYNDLLSGLWSTIPRNIFGISNRYNQKDNSSGSKITSGVNLYFDKDKIRMEQKVFSGDAETAKLLKDIFDNKQTASLTNYITEDNIGFISGSFNTEALGKYYYKTLKDYLSGSHFFGKYSELTNIYIDLLELVIDEKAIAELIPGNFVTVLHKLNTKEVTYTTYEYDDNFKEKKVKKKKQELSPEFTIAFETKKSDFMQKLVSLPTKYSEKGKVEYTYKNGYYELKLNSEKEAIDHLYFVVHDDKVVITTSMDMVQISLRKSRYKLPKKMKNFVFKNNYAVSINTNKLLSEISSELNTNTIKRIRDYLQNNIGNFKFESRIKNGIIHSSGTMDVKGTHTNSFEFLFNAFEEINRMLEEEELEEAANKL